MRLLLVTTTVYFTPKFGLVLLCVRQIYVNKTLVCFWILWSHHNPLSLSVHFEVSPSTYTVEPFLLPEVFLRVHFPMFTSCLGLNFSVFVSSFRSEYTLKERSGMFGSDLLFLEAYFLFGMGLPSSSSFPWWCGGGGGGVMVFMQLFFLSFGNQGLPEILQRTVAAT